MAGLKLSVLLNLCFVAWVSAKGCSLSLSEFEVEPVILVSNDGEEYNLFKATGATTTFDEGTKFHMVCAGSKSNKIKSLSKKTIDLTCKNGAMQSDDGKEYSIKDLQCKSIPYGETQETEEACGKNGEGKIVNIGFSYNTDKFATQFVVCYDKATQTVHYTHNVINGAAIENQISETKRKGFTAEGMGLTTTKVNNYYKKASQVKMFEGLYGKSQKYVDNKEFMARGHLTPDADWITRYEQMATYFYMNVQPEYQNINAGNWLRIEELGRKLAAQVGNDLDSYNGVYGHLEFADSTGAMQKAYLDKDKLFPVPEFFYKVLIDRSSDSGIVMISSNNPFLTDTESAQNTFCKKSVCAETNMIHDNFPDVSKGYSFCCKISDVLKVVKGLPSDVKAKKLVSLKN